MPSCWDKPWVCWISLRYLRAQCNEFWFWVLDPLEASSSYACSPLRKQYAWCPFCNRRVVDWSTKMRNHTQWFEMLEDGRLFPNSRLSNSRPCPILRDCIHIWDLLSACSAKMGCWVVLQIGMCVCDEPCAVMRGCCSRRAGTASRPPAKGRQADGRGCGMSCKDVAGVGGGGQSQSLDGEGLSKRTSEFCEHRCLLFHSYVDWLLHSTTVILLVIRNYIQTCFTVFALMITRGTISYAWLSLTIVQPFGPN